MSRSVLQYRFLLLVRTSQNACIIQLLIWKVFECNPVTTLYNYPLSIVFVRKSFKFVIEVAFYENQHKAGFAYCLRFISNSKIQRKTVFMCSHISYYRQTVSHNVHSFATKQQIWGNAISDCLIAWTLHVLLPMYWSWKLCPLSTFFTCVVSVLVPRSQKEIKFWGLSYKEWALVNNTIWYQLLSFPTQWRIDLVSTCFRPLEKSSLSLFQSLLV